MRGGTIGGMSPQQRGGAGEMGRGDACGVDAAGRGATCANLRGGPASNGTRIPLKNSGDKLFPKSFNFFSWQDAASPQAIMKNN